MKIYDSNLNGAGASGAQPAQEAQRADRARAGQASATGGAGGDRVEFSGTLGKLSQALSAFQSDRAGRVQALTAQYQSGTYRVDSGAVSRAMISDALGGGAQAGLQ